MRLIIGLGNFPKKYDQTRHNFGFLMLDFLAKRYSFEEWKICKKFSAQCAFGTIQDQKVILVKPQTYMNLSGKSVQSLMNFYKIEIRDIFVISDDIDQTFGSSIYKEKGGHGGHRGLENIIQTLNSSDFPRIKLGVTTLERKHIETSDFVLSKFSSDEQKQIPQILESTHKILLNHWH